jgi:hypothetical protein
MAYQAARAMRDNHIDSVLMSEPRGLAETLPDPDIALAYDRRKLMDKTAFNDFLVEIVRRIDHEHGFKILPRRWIVNRRTILPTFTPSSGRHPSCVHLGVRVPVG